MATTSSSSSSNIDALNSTGSGQRSVQGIGTTAIPQLHGCNTEAGVAPHFNYQDDIQVEAGQLDGQPERILPSNGMSSEPYEFVFNATDDYFVDLNSVEQHVRLKVTKADGSDLPAGTSDVWPSDNWLSTLWKSVESKFNNVALHPESASQHGYRAQIEYLLSIENTINHAYQGSWFGMTKIARHTKFKARQDGVIDLCGPVALDCLRTTTHLAPNNTMTLTFHRAKDEFVLNRTSTATENYKITILDVHLRVNRIRLLPPVKQGVLAMAQANGQNYKLTHTVINDYPVSMGQSSASIRLHSGGVLPHQVVVGMVKTSAFTGNYSEDPYEFKPFSLNQIYLRVNGVRHPQDPLTPDFDNKLYSREFMHLFKNTGKFRVNGGNSITEAEFSSTRFLVPFDLTPDQCNNAHAHMPKVGSMELELSFATALTAGITVVVLSVTNEVMKLDGLVTAPDFRLF